MDDPEACDESSPLVPTLDPSRDAHLDNCKFFLMLVVVGNHCVQDFLYVVLDTHTGRRWCQQDPVAPGLVLYLVQLLRGVYLYLNLLGMPTFTLISGYCSKGLMRSGVTGDGAGLAPRSRRMVENLLVPWLIWQLFYLAYNYRTTYPVQFWAPIGITWYLSSLFMWRGSVQYVGGLRHALPLTFTAGLAAGFTETPSTANGLVFLDYQRFLAFLPIFYLGMMEVTPARLAALRALSLPWGWAATLASLLCLCAAAWSGHCFDELQRWVWVDTPYANDSGAHPGGGGVDTSRGVAWGSALQACYRGMFYAGALVAGAGFLSIVPGGHAWYTDYGARTMYAYLLHLLVIRGYIMAQEAWFGGAMPVWLKAVMSVVVLPAGAGVGLMAPWCKRYTQWLVEPDCRWLLWAPAGGM